MVCSFCLKEKKIQARNLCGACYYRFLRHGILERIQKRYPKNTTCSFCGKIGVRCKDLCEACYDKQRYKKRIQKRTAWNKGFSFRHSGSFKKGHKINIGRKHTLETIEKMRKPKPIDFGKRLSEIQKKAYETGERKSLMLGKKHSEETRKKIGISKIGDKNPTKRPEVREKLRQARRNQILPTHHTKPELKFCRIIRRHNLPYKFTGDGSFWIENINPDFVQTNGKKIVVEIFGDYWHNREDNKKKDALKKEILEKYGWQRIVFWEHELMKIRGSDYYGSLLLL